MDLQARALGEAELLRFHVREACLDVLGLHFAFVASGVALGMERLTIDGLQSIQTAEEELKHEADDDQACLFHVNSRLESRSKCG
jgi:hypothetical protein